MTGSAAAPRPLRIVQVTMAPLKPDGGLSLYVRQVSRRLAEAGHAVTLIGHGRAGVAPSADDTAAGLTWRVAALKRGYATRLAPGVAATLRAALQDADVLHLQGMRTRLNVEASRLARRAGVPVVVSPHGQVHPWLLSQRRWRKRAVDRLWDRPIFRRAAMGVAMSPDEAEHMRVFCPGLPVRTVPIGIDPPPTPDASVRAALLARVPALAEPRRRLLFLAALNPRKGVDLLVEALARMRGHEDAQLLIAGPESDWTHAQVKAMVDRRGIDAGRVVQLPRVDEAQRTALLGMAEGFVLSSRSENFGITVLEALSAGVPVVATTATPWAALDPDGTVLCVEPEAAALAEGMGTLLGESAEARAARIERGRRMVAERFAWPAVIARLEALYRDVVAGFPVERV